MSNPTITAINLVDKIKKSISNIPKQLDFDYLGQLDYSGLPSFLKLGNLINHNGLIYPCLLPTNRLKGLVFHINDTNREEIHLAIQNYSLQLLNKSKGDIIEMSVFDTKKMGSNFRLLRKLAKQKVPHFCASEDMQSTTLDYHYNKSVSIINECLTNYKSLAEYNDKSGHQQKYRIVIIADFPFGFRENIEKINSILTNADDAGIILLMSYDNSLVSKLNEDKVQKIINQLINLKEFGDPARDYYKVEYGSQQIPIFNIDYTLQLDRKEISEDNLIKEVQFTSTPLATDADQIDGLRIPIGKALGETQYLIFGYDTDNFHAIIGGQSGKGKTVLLNNIIARGVECYSTDELRYLIIDCGGTGFHEFDNSMHMQLMCRSSNVEICHEAVQKVEQELIYREELFQKEGVPDLKKYLAKTKKKLPRLICIIDEFHVLYTGKDKHSAYFDSILIERVIRIGRKFGVHLIVCTQSLGGGVRRSILDNIPLRIALGMTTDQSYGFLGLKNDSASNLERGKAIYNPQNGDPNFNKSIQVNYISEEDVDRIVQHSNNISAASEPFERIIK